MSKQVSTFNNAVDNPRKATQIRCNFDARESKAIKSAYSAEGRPEPIGPTLSHNISLFDWLRAVAVRQDLEVPEDFHIDEPKNIDDGTYWPAEISLTYQEQEILLDRYSDEITRGEGFKHNGETSQAFRRATQEFISQIIKQ